MDTPLNHPKRKTKSKLGRKQRKRRSSARTRKIETDPLLASSSSSREPRENQEEEEEDGGLFIVEIGRGSGGDLSTCAITATSKNNLQPLPPQQSPSLPSSPSSSMPETAVASRSKRLRGATTATIAYTDRKTRSTSSSLSHNSSNTLTTNSHIFIIEGQEQVQGEEEEEEEESSGQLLQISSPPTENRFLSGVVEKPCPQLILNRAINNYTNEENEKVERDEKRDAKDIANNQCDSSSKVEFVVEEKVVPDNDDGTGRGSITLENIPSMKSELKKDEEKTDEASEITEEEIAAQEKATQRPVVEEEEEESLRRKFDKSSNCQPEKKVKEGLDIDGGSGSGSEGPNFNTRIVVGQNVAQIDVDTFNASTREGGHEIKASNSKSSSRGLVTGEKHVRSSAASASSGGGGGGGGFSCGGKKKCKVVQERKLTTLAPMLLMNNLPYMGELTFDTRPRRGRKPKKADICHLISKNYGIHFPNSYTNTPYTGPPPPSTINSAPFSSSSSGEKGSSSLQQQTLILHGKKSSKNSGGKKKSNKSGSTFVSSCPTSSSWDIIVPSSTSLLSQQPPALLPISTTNTTTTSHRFKSQPSPFSLSSTGSKSLVNNNAIGTESQKRDSSGSKYNNNGGGEEPLNLCVRDASDARKSFQLASTNSSTLVNLNSFSKNCTEIMNLKLPLLSSNLFSDFQLKPQTNDKGSSNTSKKRDRAIEEGSKKFKSSNSSSGNKFLSSSSSSNLSIGRSGNSSNALPNLGENTTIRDLGLVNQLNFQLNLAKCAHFPSSAESSSSSSLIHHQSRREPFGFVPLRNNPKTETLLASQLPRVTKNKGEGGRKSSSSSRKKGLLLTSSSLLKNNEEETRHVPTTTGGSLFGHTDSGSSSGAQVSICKFKFTGGAKPSLQEKKMLSVDSGGNFRFYTDKDKVGGSSSNSSLKSSKGQQGVSHSSSLGGCGKDGGESHQGMEKDGNHHQQGIHYAYSALPKSAKSMSVCMPCVRPSSSSCLKLPTPSSSPNSSAVLIGDLAGNTKTISTILSADALQQQQGTSAINVHQGGGDGGGAVTPTAQELNNLHLDAHGRFAFPASSSSPSHQHYPDGEDGYSSSQSSESGGPTSHHHTNSSLLSFGGGGGGPSTSGHFDAEAFKTRKLLRLKRKRRTRKSLMREKLEKTFKEKGFLIQTQQLESAEGATYCKFRQLRKFTRYLFRSWKDYLPDNVKDINNGAGGAGGGCATSGGVLVNQNSSPPPQDEEAEDEGLQNEWKRMSNNNPATAVSGMGDDDDCDEEEDDDEDGTRLGMMELVPEVTLITQPSTPVTIVDDDDDEEANITGSEEDEGEVVDGSDDGDDDDDNDVDVEQIDDRGGDFNSDNHNSP